MNIHFEYSALNDSHTHFRIQTCEFVVSCKPFVRSTVTGIRRRAVHSTAHPCGSGSLGSVNDF